MCLDYCVHSGGEDLQTCEGPCGFNPFLMQERIAELEERADSAVVQNWVDTMSAIVKAATGLEDLDACEAEFDRVGKFPSDYIRHLRERAEAAEAITKTLPTIGRLVGTGEDREIVFDVPLVLGMSYWYVEPRRGWHISPECTALKIALEADGDSLIDDGLFPCHLLNTRAAAEFAIEQAKGISS